MYVQIRSIEINLLHLLKLPVIYIFCCDETQSAVRLVRLLINQARNVRQTDPLDRFAAIYLSEVLILNNRVLIENRILDDVKTVREICFVQNYVVLVFSYRCCTVLCCTVLYCGCIQNAPTVYAYRMRRL